MTFELNKLKDEKKKESGLEKIVKDLRPLEDLAKSEGKDLYEDYDTLPEVNKENLILKFTPKNEEIVSASNLLKNKISNLKNKITVDSLKNLKQLTDKTYLKSVAKKVVFTTLSKAYVATRTTSEKLNHLAILVSKNTMETGLLGVKGYVHRLAIDLENITNKKNVEDIREYLKEITFSDKYEKEKELSKKEAFEELKKPEYRLGNYLAKKLSKLASIKEEYIPKNLKSAKRIRENMSAIGMGLILGGQMYKRQIKPSAEVMATSEEMIAKADFLTSYAQSPITALQLGLSFMAFTNQGYWTSVGYAFLATNLETKARSELYRRTGTYVPAPTKLITPTTLITTGLATVHEGYNFIRENEEKLSKKSAAWRNNKKDLVILYKGTLGQIDTNSLNLKTIKQDFKEIYESTIGQIKQ